MTIAKVNRATYLRPELTGGDEPPMSNIIHLLPTHFQKDVRQIEIEKSLQRGIKAIDGLPLQVEDLITLDRVTSTVLQFTRSGAIRRIEENFYYVRDPYGLGVQPITIHPNPEVTQ